MNAISKESILRKTHYGLTIYSHILRLYYPDEVVLRLVGREAVPKGSLLFFYAAISVSKLIDFISAVSCFSLFLVKKHIILSKSQES
ncbi:MAG: hypothetical protein LBV74_09530, partial [Tannerella sp.]|nr:hypothetical protein [Tannerella sp.]